MTDVTRILSAIASGDPRAAGGLLPPVYSEPRKLAGQKWIEENPGQALLATALEHVTHPRLAPRETARG